MKRIFALTPLIGLILLMTSCVSTKKIVYFQGSDSIFSQAQDIMQQYEMKLKPADQILIKLTCSEPELLNIFAQDVVMGTAGSSISTNITNQGNMTNAYAYTVTNDGCIILPAVGKVKVEGMTTDETAKRIEESIQEKNHQGSRSDCAPAQRTCGRDRSRDDSTGGKPYQRTQYHPGCTSKVW